MKTTVTIDDIIRVADKAYPDGRVLAYHQHPKGKHGDTLAEFIAIELRETFTDAYVDRDEDEPYLYDDPYVYAAEKLETAISELQAAADALRREGGE